MPFLSARKEKGEKYTGALFKGVPFLVHPIFVLLQFPFC
jgi:hypothetical protein